MFHWLRIAPFALEGLEAVEPSNYTNTTISREVIVFTRTSHVLSLQRCGFGTITRRIEICTFVWLCILSGITYRYVLKNVLNGGYFDICLRFCMRILSCFFALVLTGDILRPFSLNISYKTEIDFFFLRLTNLSYTLYTGLVK